jgi:branched-chain amino acid transport system permease protein
MTNPQILLCDEISLGLAPVIVKELYAQLKRINANGTTLIVVEQDIKQVMSVSDRVYCVRKGRVVLEGRPSDLSREDVAKGYYGLQRGIFNRTLNDDILRPVLVSFGLSLLLQNALLRIFSADTRRLDAGNLETMHIDLPGGIAVGLLPCLMFVVALAVVVALQLLLYHTELGRAFRAVSDDQETAQLMGINNAHVFGLAMALSLAIVSVAGVFLGIRANFDPSIGPTRLLFAFEAIVIGGLGDLWGTLAGGVILGVAQTVGARINPGYQMLAGHLVFLAILVLRPQGFFAKTH